jgi:hypothetical protein
MKTTKAKFFVLYQLYNIVSMCASETTFVEIELNLYQF